MPAEECQDLSEGEMSKCNERPRTLDTVSFIKCCFSDSRVTEKRFPSE